MKRLIFLAIPAAVLAACAAEPPAEPVSVGMPNPAAAFCIEKGGEILPGANPGEDAVCKLRDGRKVGEWEYFNEHHRPEPAPAS
ncbi:DUF333 domain-containing protein [Rhodobacter maris]|uniref:Hemolysin n=1 Tax=Rhodobacter maris TaxID=446682 RepID=A0A285RXT1_9RHOB|nr:DUF333 domain-containing protein [Rhodobacter maris]SOB98866.1 hypothetical protein SAMN05877831_10276 [Rhodobacter maris]